MDNREIAEVFDELADLTEIIGGDPHRVRSFRRVARILSGLRTPVATMVKFHTLERTPGIGEGTVHRIKEIIRTGTCSDFADLKARVPGGMRDLLKVHGIGVKRVRYLWQHERISTVDQLEVAARSGRLNRLPGFGESAVEKILQGIARFRKHVGRLLLADALAVGFTMRDAMRAEPAVTAAELTGSARRRKETVGDLDILIASDDPVPCITRFVSLPQIEEVITRGDSKVSAIIASGQQIDMRVVPAMSWGAGLHYFTGSQQHNIFLRARGNRRGLKISEKGVFRRADERPIDPCETEERIFAAVGLPWIPPELRENTGELEAAAKGTLPALADVRALRGDLHVHSGRSEGATGTPGEIAEAAARLGLQYVAITDHANVALADLDAARIRRAGDDHGVDLLAAVEVAIRPDGTLEGDLRALEQADFVVASVLSDFEMGAAEMTARMIKAMETGLVDVIGHPTGRLLAAVGNETPRHASALDLEKFLKSARRLDVAVEMNGDPRRLDLEPGACRFAAELGVPVSIASDAHAPHEMARLSLAIAVARRGWLESKNILNARPLDEILLLRRERMRRVGVVVSGVVRETKKRRGTASRTPGVDLAAALAERPLATWLLERLEAFLHEPDAELERALAASEPKQRSAAQKAFDLLLSHGR